MITSILSRRSKKDPLELIDAFEKASQPTIGDLMYVGQRHKARILDRTQRGVDVNNASFAPYSTSGPYYYYPGKNAKNRRAAVLRFAKKIGAKKDAITRLGIKFKNYGEFKFKGLGRTTVDLRGPTAPHMLQALLVRAQGIDGASESDQTPVGRVSEIAIGIYGPEAERADAHNRGKVRMPKRKFIGSNATDNALAIQDVMERIMTRVRKIFK